MLLSDLQSLQLQWGALWAEVVPTEWLHGNHLLLSIQLLFQSVWSGIIVLVLTAVPLHWPLINHPRCVCLCMCHGGWGDVSSLHTQGNLIRILFYCWDHHELVLILWWWQRNQSDWSFVWYCIVYGEMLLFGFEHYYEVDSKDMTGVLFLDLNLRCCCYMVTTPGHTVICWWYSLKTKHQCSVCRHWTEIEEVWMLCVEHFQMGIGNKCLSKQ